MAENREQVTFGNFSIQENMDSLGNQELLSGLWEEESATATGNPDEIEKIEKKPAKPITTSETTTVKPPVKSKEEIAKESQDELKKSLTSEEEEEENEEEKPKPKKKVQKVEDSENSEEGDEEEKENTFSTLSKELFNLNVFTKDEGEEDVVIDTPEKFLARFNEEKRKGAIDEIQRFISQFGEDYQNAFDAIFVKGVNPSDYYITANKIESFAKMDLTKESNQQIVVQQLLTDQGFEPEDIQAEIEKLKNNGDLETTSQRYHKVLVRKEATKLQQLEEDKVNQQRNAAAIKQQYIQNVQAVLQEKLKTKEFDGIPINPTLATELQDYLLVDKYKLASGELLTDFDKDIIELKDPKNHSKKVKIGLLLKMLEKDPSLASIQRVGVTKSANGLFEKLTNSDKSKTTKTKSENPVNWNL